MQINSFCKKLIVLVLSLMLSAGFIFAQDFDYEEFLKTMQQMTETEETPEEEVAPVEIIEIDPAETDDVDATDVEDIDNVVDVDVADDVDMPDETDSADAAVDTDIDGVDTTETYTTDLPNETDETEAAAETDATDLTEESEETEEAEKEEHEYQALALIRYKNTDTISFKLKISYIPKPYILGISLAAGYTEYKLLQPFYFGGYLEPHVGIPQKGFPYKYTLSGKSINGPLIVGGKLYMPFGICVFPFQQNIEFFVEFAPGITLDMMWNAKFGKESISSKLFPAFYGMLRTGATYKGFTFFIEGNYDAILGFGVSAGIGYSLNFNITSTVDHAPSLE